MKNRKGFTMVDSLVGIAIICGASFIYLETNHIQHQRLKESHLRMEKARARYENKIWNGK